MSEIKYMEKPDWVSWESIKECLISGHELNRKKGVFMHNQTLSPEELSDYLKDAYCFVALDGEKLVGTCSLKVIDSKQQWWAHGQKVAYTCLDAIVPGYKGTDVYFELNKTRDKCINDLGIKIIEFSTHENNNLVQRINLRLGAKYVRYCALRDTDYYSVVMVFWLDGCPFSDWYCDYRFKLSKFLTRIVFKPGRKFRFWF